jgi:hypothetical protein
MNWRGAHHDIAAVGYATAAIPPTHLLRAPSADPLSSAELPRSDPISYQVSHHF